MYGWFFFLGWFSATMFPLSIAGSFRCRWRGCGDASCITADTSWSCELPTSSYEWNKVINFVRHWNKWQFRLVVTIFVHAEWRTWPCLSTHPRWCLRHSPPRTHVHPMKPLLRYAVVELDGAHQCLQCSCSEMRAVEHSCVSSTNKLMAI
jgi:hypothetical protein